MGQQPVKVLPFTTPSMSCISMPAAAIHSSQQHTPSSQQVQTATWCNHHLMKVVSNFNEDT
jgi:hypothetical protein